LFVNLLTSLIFLWCKGREKSKKVVLFRTIQLEALFLDHLVFFSEHEYTIAIRRMTMLNICPVASEPVTSIIPDDDVPYDAKQPYNADEEALAALGYKSEFKREFSLYATCAVSFAILGLLPSFASTLFFSMGYAGTAGMAWGWPIAMIGIQFVAMSMAELYSSMPTSGGMYYAAAVLAPPGWAPLASWVTCWSNWLVQITGAPSGKFTFTYFEVWGGKRGIECADCVISQ